MQTDRPDMTKLLAAFRNFENAPDKILKCRAACFCPSTSSEKRPWNPQHMGGHQDKFGRFGEQNNPLRMPGTEPVFPGRSVQSLKGVRYAGPPKRR